MSPAKQIRVTNVGLAVVLIAALYTINSHFGWDGMVERPLVVLATFAGLMLLLTSFFISIQPTPTLERIHGRILNISKPTIQENESNKTIAKVALIIALIGFLVTNSAYSNLLTQDSHSDPAAFLRFAKETQDNGGPLQLLCDLYTGNYVQANQHPFYIGLLSISPDLASGKTLSFIATAITFLSIIIYLVKTHSWQAAAIASTLLATNHTFCYFSGLATCEAWLTLFISLAWISISQAVKSNSLKQALGYWFCAGLLMGLAYLTKGTGLVFLGALTLSALAFGITYKQNSSKTQRAGTAAVTVAVVIGGWIITAHPLLVRNTLVYDSPTFNVNSYFLYMDEFPAAPEIQARLAASDSLAEVRQDFLDRHTITELLQREVKGVGWETLIFTRSLGPSPLGESRVLFGIAVLVLLLLTLLHLDRTLQIFITALIVSSILVFAWYIPIAAGERFTAPLLPLIMASAGVGLYNTVANRSKVTANMTMMACLGWTMLWTTFAVSVI